MSYSDESASAGVIAESRLFDADYYREQAGLDSHVDAARHYCAEGWRKGYSPSNWFSTRYYLASNKDVRENHWNPLAHYILEGARQRRKPHSAFDVSRFVELHESALNESTDPAILCIELYGDYRFDRHGGQSVLDMLSRPRTSGAIKAGAVQKARRKPSPNPKVAAEPIPVPTGAESLLTSSMVEAEEDGGAVSGVDVATQPQAVAHPQNQRAVAVAPVIEEQRGESPAVPYHASNGLGGFLPFSGKKIVGWIRIGALSPSSADLLFGGVKVLDLATVIPGASDRSDEGMHSVARFEVGIDDIAGSIRKNKNRVQERDGRIEVRIQVGDEVVDRLELQTDSLIEGRIEQHENGIVTGWALRPFPVHRPLRVQLQVNGRYFAKATASQRRGDIVRAYPGREGGAFQFLLPQSPVEATDLDLSVLTFPDDHPLPMGRRRVSLPSSIQARRTYARNVIASANPECAVIIPVYNAADELDACLTSIEEHVDPDVTVIVVDDCSPDPRVSIVLEKHAKLFPYRIRHNIENKGFTRTVNYGIGLAGDADVILLNSDTIVTPRWIEGLRAAAYSGPRVGTATAISDNSGAFSVPFPGQANELPERLSRNQYARALRHENIGVYPSMSTGNGFCLYIRQDCLSEVGLLDEEAFPRGYGEENDFCMRAWRLGWSHVIDDKTFVFHKRSASFGEAKTELYRKGREIVDERYPEYGITVQSFDNSFDLQYVRFSSGRVHAGDVDVSSKLPRVLYVISTKTGGTPQTNADLMSGLSDEFDTWLLACDSRILELSKAGVAGKPVASHVFEAPIPIVRHTSEEYNDIITSWLQKYGIDVVHIRHVAWHSLGIVDACKALGIPIVFSFHDFYTVCPTIKLLDNNKEFCGGRCTPGEGRCEAELWDARSVPTLKHKWVRRWQEMYAEFLGKCDAFVTTAESARAIILQTYPFLIRRDFRVIPHGRAVQMVDLSSVPDGGEPIRVVVPGNISEAKGAREILAMRDADTSKRIHFHILGDALPFLQGDRIIRHGKYMREDFEKRIADIRPHFGAVFSIWPETYCHTLTELWASGIPVLAFEMGAVGDRISKSGGGWFLPPKDAGRCVEIILKTAGTPAVFNEGRRRVLDWQRGIGRLHNLPWMSERYAAMYRSVMRRGVRAEQTRIVAVGLGGDWAGSALLRNDVDRIVRVRHMPPEEIRDLGAGSYAAVWTSTAASDDAFLEAVRAASSGFVPLVVDTADFRALERALEKLSSYSDGDALVSVRKIVMVRSVSEDDDGGGRQLNIESLIDDYGIGFTGGYERFVPTSGNERVQLRGRSGILPTGQEAWDFTRAYDRLVTAAIAGLHARAAARETHMRN